MIIYLHEKSKEQAAIYLAAFFIRSNNRTPKPMRTRKGKTKVATIRIASPPKGFDTNSRPINAKIIRAGSRLYLGAQGQTKRIAEQKKSQNKEWIFSLLSSFHLFFCPLSHISQMMKEPITHESKVTGGKVCQLVSPFTKHI
ncbi:hypothetical protein EV579_3155 [Bacillus sp. BK450]|nr:hypothetical protein EV579_3155 [Bacillus sp. BK450]